MAYCSVLTDVQNRVPAFTISVSSLPSTTQVQALVDGAAAEIDSALATHGLSVPVATPSWFVADLLDLNAKGAAAQALIAWAPDLEPTTTGGMTLAKTYWDYYQMRLKQFRAGEGIPVATVTADAVRAPRGYFDDSGACVPGGMGTDQWGEEVNSEPLFTAWQVF